MQFNPPAYSLFSFLEIRNPSPGGSCMAWDINHYEYEFNGFYGFNGFHNVCSGLMIAGAGFDYPWLDGGDGDGDGYGAGEEEGDGEEDGTIYPWVGWGRGWAVLIDFYVGVRRKI